MPVGHQITGAFPAADIARRDRPGRAGQIAFAGEKLEIDRRAEKTCSDSSTPRLSGTSRSSSVRVRKKSSGLQIEPLDHVLLGGVVFVAGRNGVAIDAEIGEIIEHLLDLLHVGFLVNRRVRRDLIAENLRHLDRQNAFLENAFALHDQIVRAFQARRGARSNTSIWSDQSLALPDLSVPCEFRPHLFR